MHVHENNATDTGGYGGLKSNMDVLMICVCIFVCVMYANARQNRTKNVFERKNYVVLIQN